MNILLLQNADIWYVVEYRLDVCMATMATSGAHSKLAQGMTHKEKKNLLTSSLQQYDFNICALFTSLLIRPSNRLHYLYPGATAYYCFLKVGFSTCYIYSDVILYAVTTL